jgi:BirA family biotin operon repressor/biotin-[acetyl-CoA-carboxylase] ligase
MGFAMFATLKIFSLQIISKVLFLCHSKVMDSNLVFNLLNIVDSTNNYAMAQIHAGLAKHGEAYFALSQTAGKGQRNKHWHSQPGENILITIAIESPRFFEGVPFLFNAAVSLVCKQFLEQITSEIVKIKWPNDLYIRDRKAGGLLIENIFRGKSWNWAAIGIGVNVNQTGFPEATRNPISIKHITELKYDSEQLARQLQQKIVAHFDELSHVDEKEIMKFYNEALFAAGKKVTLKHKDEILETTVIRVNPDGQLITSDIVERQFNFGEVEWVAPSIPQ